LDLTRRALLPHFLQRVALIAFLALHFIQIFLFNNLSSASGKRAIFVTCYYFSILIRYIARLMDVKGYNVFHQKSPSFIEFAIFFTFNKFVVLLSCQLKVYLLVTLFIPWLYA